MENGGKTQTSWDDFRGRMRCKSEGGSVECVGVGVALSRGGCGPSPFPEVCSFFVQA